MKKRDYEDDFEKEDWDDFDQTDGYEAWGMDRPEPGEDDVFEGWGNE